MASVCSFCIHNFCQKKTFSAHKTKLFEKFILRFSTSNSFKLAQDSKASGSSDFASIHQLLGSKQKTWIQLKAWHWKMIFEARFYWKCSDLVHNWITSAFIVMHVSFSFEGTVSWALSSVATTPGLALNSGTGVRQPRL